MKTNKHKLLFRHLQKSILVFLCGFMFFSALIGTGQPARAAGASLYISPREEGYEIGEVFSVNVSISSQVAANAGRAVIKFPSEKIEVLDISKDNSIFTIWLQRPVFSNSIGEVSFLGGLLDPGYSGEAGNIITITFRAKSEGRASLIFKEEAISANDSEGTNIFSFSQGASFTIFADFEPLLSFKMIVDNENDETNPQPLLYFETTDNPSKISHYEIKIGEDDFFRIELEEANPFRLPYLLPGTYQIIARSFDKLGNYINSETNIRVESITSPQVTVCPKTYNAGEEILYIGGTALSDHTVIVFLKSEGEIVKSWEVYSDEKGEWFLIENGLFRPGIYTVSAKAKDVRGAISDFSKECSIGVFLKGLAVGPWIIDYKTLTLFALIILVILFLTAFYLFLKIKKTQRTIKREAEDLKQKFYKEYEELQKDIEKELEVLRELRGKQEIKEGEKKREAELLKNLKDVKEVFEKELKDIEKELER